MRPLLAAATAALLSGCAIQQKVTPVADVDGREACIVENDAVRPGFVQELRSALSNKGFDVRLLRSGTALDSCRMTLTYSARWSWDLALYMSYAEIRVFRQGAPAGEAVYDSTGGSANMGKFIEAGVKVRELVQQLFPTGAKA
jgi:hypothetical protein